MSDDVLKSPYPQQKLSEKEKRELSKKRLGGDLDIVIAQCSDCKFFLVIDRKTSCLKNVYSEDVFDNKIICKSKQSRIKK